LGVSLRGKFNFLEKSDRIHLGASEATRLRQGFGVVNSSIDYLGARD